MVTAKLNSRREPTFLWQGLLLVLPVLILSGVGFFSLRQDRVLAQHEATQRAQSIAEDLLPRLWNELVKTSAPVQFGPYSFEIDSAGRLIFPPPVAVPPVPTPLHLERLNQEQLQLWERARQSECDERALAAAASAYEAFLKSSPPPTFTAAAQYSLGVVSARQGDPKAALKAFGSVIEEFPGAIGESGLPLAPLAELKVVEISDADANQYSRVSLGKICSNAVEHPTLLSPILLQKVSERARTSEVREAVRRWQHVWQEQETSRRLFAETRSVRSTQLFPRPNVFWITLPESFKDNAAPGSTNHLRTDLDWLVIAAEEHSTPPNELLQLISETETAKALQSKVDLRPPLRRKNYVDGSFDGPLPPDWPDQARSFGCRSQTQIEQELSALIITERNVPEYFGIGLEVAGKELTGLNKNLRLWHETHYISRRGGGLRKEYSAERATNILASASHREAGADALKVNVFLTSPSVLFEYQRARSFWFTSLIGVSSIAAIFGLLTAWRAFHRQQQLTDLKSNFVSSVSHELRAPIASVRLLAESLERGKITEPQKQGEYFRFIGQECRRLSSLIENVLDFSRIEQGRKQYDFEPTDVVALVEQTVKLMEPYGAEKQVTLELRLPESQIPASGFQPVLDGRAMQQALVNLIDNAIKHSPKGQKVTLGLEIPMIMNDEAQDPEQKSQTWNQNRSMSLWVEDNGPGIPEREHEKIFERFYRLGSELRRETPGVGIGLSIVKHIVEAHGGRIVVRSAAGEGSRFTIELPVREAV